MVPSIRVQDHPQDSGRALRDSPVPSQHPPSTEDQTCTSTVISVQARRRIRPFQTRKRECVCVCVYVSVSESVCRCVSVSVSVSVCECAWMVFVDG